MKYLIVIVAALLVSGCDMSTPKPIIISSDDTENRLYNRALEIVDSTTYLVKENQAKRMTLKRTNKLLHPLALQLDSITKMLPANEQEDIKKYRIKQANLIIDGMVEGNNR